MSDKFVAEYAQLVTPACDTCKHRSKVRLGYCLAFPDGIPFDILTGKDDHFKPVKGDHGIQHEAIIT